MSGVRNRWPWIQLLGVLCLAGVFVPEVSGAGDGPAPGSAPIVSAGSAAGSAGSGSPGSGSRGLHARSVELNEQGVQAAKANDASRALALFEEALSADQRNVAAVVNLATTYVTLARGQDAERLLLRYAERYPDDAVLAARLGDVFFAGKEPRKALPWYEKAYRIDSSGTVVIGRLATLYTLEKRLPEAEAMLRKAAEADPKNPEYIANLANVQLANGKIQEAIATSKQALSLRSSKELYVTLGTAYELAGEYGKALIAFRRARDLGDSRAELLRKIEGLEEAVEG